MQAVVKFVFLSAFARALRRQNRWAPDRRELAAAMAGLRGGSHMPGGDAPARRNLMLAQALQAAVQILQGRGFGRDRAVEMAGAAFLKTGSGLTRLFFAWWLRVTKDPVHDMKRRRDLAEKARKLWGEGMKLEEVHDGDDVALLVHDCPFAHYFWSVSEPDLTPILCAYDAQWMAQVNRSNRPVRVSRNGTLAAGAEACDFTFVRTKQPEPARAAARMRPDTAR